MEKIDFVIPWVDGSDQAWLEERKSVAGENIIESQYRDWGLLKYWFRMVEENAPWVNKIHFITWGHLPDFLDTSHPKINIVKHEDFIPEKYLPTFTSNVIETNMHRIEGLSEAFVYFNDDIYMIKETQPKDFFHKGLPRDAAISKPIAPARYETICNTMINNIGVVNEHYNKTEATLKNPGKWFNYRYGILNLLNLIFLPWKRFIGLYEQHTANSFLKSTFEEVWEKEYEVLNRTGKTRVRNHKTDVNQWLFKNWRIAKGEFIPRSTRFSKYIMVKSEKEARQARDIILQGSYKLLCINDHVKDGDQDLEKIEEIIKKGFEEKFPNKSSFEK